MKNSVSSASLSSLSSSSSSASSVLEKPRTKRTRRNAKTDAANTKKSCTSKRSSIYRGVTRHRWTGRYEAHLWDKFCWNDTQRKKGRQVYLGAYECEDAAARTYDLAALKYWGPDTILNFSVEMYEKELEEMQCISREEYLALLRRRSNGFARGLSKFRGVARHHHNGRWEARIGRVLGNKYLYLGTFSNILSNMSNSSFGDHHSKVSNQSRLYSLCILGTQEEAARAYDKAALQYRGPGAVTNFDKGIYVGQLEAGIVADPHHQLPQLPNLNCQPILQQQQLQQSEIVVPQMLPPSAYDANWISTIPTSMIDTSSFLDNCDLSDWISCLDTEFNQYPVHEFPLGMQDDGLPDIFTAAGFDDDINIDFLFDSGFEENEVYLRCSDGNDGFGSENICSSSSSTTSSIGSS